MSAEPPLVLMVALDAERSSAIAGPVPLLISSVPLTPITVTGPPSEYRSAPAIPDTVIVPPPDNTVAVTPGGAAISTAITQSLAPGVHAGASTVRWPPGVCT